MYPRFRIGLYSHFKPPGAFGGARIDCPWETKRTYKKLLEEKEHCEVVIPLQHTYYVPDDHNKTCRMFDFPNLLSGHGTLKLIYYTTL